MTVRVDHLVTRRVHLRADLAHYAPSVILAGYGIFILSLWVRNDLTLYINPTYVWPTVLAGFVLLVLAIARLLPGRVAACSCDDGCGCDAAPTHLWPYVVLSGPLLLAAVLPPASLAAFSARQRGPEVAGLSVVNMGVPVKHVSLSVDTRTLSLQDWAGALSADPNPSDYLNKPVNVTGIVIHNPGSVPVGTIMVIRYQVTCCIADARPIGMIVVDTSHGELKDNQWVRVTGKMGEMNFEGQKVAVVEPSALTPTKSGNPYIY